MQKKFLKIFSLTLLAIALIPKGANAIFGLSEDLWGWNEMALDALDFFDNVIISFLWRITLLLLGSFVSLLISTGLFNWAISLTPSLSLADPTGNPLVWAGWNFCRGLANLFILLILVYLALAYILKIEVPGGEGKTYVLARKAIPKLIIVALLINFSLLFVGMGVDISQIMIKGLTNSLGTDLASLVTSPLTLNYSFFLIIYTAIILGYVAVATIPLANVAYILAIIFLLIAFTFFGFLTFTIVLIIFGFALAFIFFTLSFTFILRIGIIQVLAILAPIAFICSVLPQTKKYWNQWLNLLVEWLVWGVIAVFLSGLGLKLAGKFPTGPEIIARALGGVVIFTPQLFQYLFLLIYLAIVYYFTTKKFAPEMAGFLIGTASGFFARGMPMVTAPLKTGYERFMVEQRRKEEEFKAKVEEGKKLTAREQLRKYVGGLAAAPGRFIYRARGITPEAEISRSIEKEAENFEKTFGENVEAAIASQTIRGKLIGTREKKMGLALYAERKQAEKGLKKFSDKDFAEIARDLYTYGNKAQRKEFKKFARARIEENPELESFVNVREVDNEDIARLIRDRVKIDGIEAGELWKGSAADREKVIREAARRNTIESLKAEDYEKILPETAEKMKESIVRYGRERRGIGRMIEKGILDWGKIQNEIKRLGIREVAKTNAPLVLFPYSPLGRMLGAERPVDERGEIISESKMREIIAEQQRNALSLEEARRIVGRRPIVITPPPPTPRPPGRPGSGPATGRTPGRP